MPRKYTEKQKAAYYRKKAASEKRRASTNARRMREAKYAMGSGAYSLPGLNFSSKKLGGYLGGAAGATIGNMIAPGIGGEIGSELGSQGGKYMGRLFKKITGWGDYEVKSNSLMYDNEVVPSFGEDSIRIRKREFISSINSTASVFSNLHYDINPGLDRSFPWLSSIARNYEQYRINGMIFQFVSTSSDAIASTTALGLGQVILATNYDAASEVFQDATQMLNYMFANSGKPSDNIMHAIECAPSDTAQKLYYVRTGAAPTGTDPRLYDLGKFQLAVNNMPASYNGMGQLWVSYDITFCKSIQNNALGYSLNNDQFNLTSGITTSNVFGDGGTTDYAALEGSNLGCELNENTIYFPANLFSGYYLISLSWAFTSGTVTSPSITPTNCKPVICWEAGTSARTTAPNTAATAATCQMQMVVKLGTTDNATQAQLAFSSFIGTLSALTTVRVLISQVNGDIYDEFALSSASPF